MIGGCQNEKQDISSTLKMVSDMLRPYRGAVLKIAIILMVIAVCSSILPFFTAKVVDDGFVIGNHQRVVLYSMLFLTVNFLMLILYLLCEYIRLKGYHQIKYDLKEQAVKKICTLEINYFNEHNPSSIFQKLDADIEVISGIFSTEIIFSALQMIVTLGYIIAMFKINVELTLLLFVFMPVKLLISLFFSKRNVKITGEANRANTEYSSWFGELVSSIKYIRFYNLQSYFYEQFYKKQKQIMKYSRKKGFLEYANLQTESFVIQLTISMIYIVTGHLISEHKVSLGDFVAIQIFAISVLSFVSQFFDIIFAFSSLLPSVKRYNDFLLLKDEISADTVTDVGVYDLVLEDIGFAYENGKNIFSGLTLSFPEGSKTAIIGGNGVGKTSLFNLITRLYKPLNGNIFLGNVNVNRIDMGFYRSLFSVVGQQVYLFNDSIRNNICLYKKISQNELDAVIESVELSDFIKEKTLEFSVGENGAKLSGGQRQKIALARAIINDAHFFLFDEVASNLDKNFERILKKVIENYCVGKTVICITHRSNIIKLMDRVVELKR